jgi:hypothetical protein
MLTGSGRREEGTLWPTADGGLVRVTDAHSRRDRIANIRKSVTNAVLYGLWSKEMYEEHIAAHPMPVRRCPDSGRDVLTDFELAYWTKAGAPISAVADLI